MIRTESARGLAKIVVPWLVIAAAVAGWKLSEGWGWKGSLFWWGIYGAILVSLAWVVSNDALVRRIVPPASARSLGIIRAVVCLILLGSTVWEDVVSTALIPEEIRRVDGLVGGLFYTLPFKTLLSSGAFLAGLKWTTTGALVCGLLGLRTRVALPAACVGYALIAGIMRFYCWYYHTGLVPLYLLVILCFTPCSDDLSLDAYLRKRAGQAASAATPEVYGLARYACWLAVAVPYIAAGLSKLRNDHLRWFNPDNMRMIVFMDSLQPMEFSFNYGIIWRHHLPNIAFTLMAAGAVGAELGYAVVLVSRWGRLIMPLSILGLHAGILFLQNILFPDLIAVQAIFLLDRQSPPPPSAAGYPLRGRVGIFGVAAVLLLGWTLQVEQFPITGMQMYTGYLRPPSFVPGRGFYYIKVRAVRADGVTVPRAIETAIPALRDTRYRDFINSTFRTADQGGRDPVRMCAFMQVVARRQPAQESLAEIEVERWAWDHQREPTGAWDSQPDADGLPAAGHLVDRYTWDLRREPLEEEALTPAPVVPRERSRRIPCGPGTL